ncbi:MAG TPA: diaminopimelate epimerase [Micromonosporaceae bacterium]
MRFAKGHGTGNDFVILPDPDGALPLTADLVVALCDRRLGIGADGVLRVVRTAKHPVAAGHAGDAEWFMDYWNCDGSLAEMCGNGVRVFARYLTATGLAEGPAVPVATRSGVVVADVAPDTVTVDMVPPRLGPSGVATVSGRQFAGTSVTVGNPNLVCPVDDLSGLDLTVAPGLDPALFPHAANVEFVRPGDGTPDADRHVVMRVFERGAGETLSCGSGACAVAAAVLAEAGLDNGVVAVDVPGGRLRVTIAPGRCRLAGPAVIVATGDIDPTALVRPV